MNMVAERAKVVMSEVACVDIVSVDNVMLEWANNCLREVIWAGRTEEAAFYKRALDNIAWVKSGERAGSLIDDCGRMSALRSALVHGADLKQIPTEPIQGSCPARV